MNRFHRWKNVGNETVREKNYEPVVTWLCLRQSYKLLDQFTDQKKTDKGHLYFRKLPKLLTIF